MQLRTATLPSAVLAFALSGLFSACSSTPSREAAPVQVDAMVSWIERVHVEAERSQLSIAESFERLNVIAAGRFDKEPAAQAYARLVQATDEATQQAKRFRECVGLHARVCVQQYFDLPLRRASPLREDEHG